MVVMELVVVGLAVWSYHRERISQGLGNRIIEPEFSPTGGAGEVNCGERLGGLLRYYYRDAA